MTGQKEEAAETHGWDDDLIASDLVYASVRGETSRVAYNPTHRWYYFSDMQTDEVLFIRVHDSANDRRARLSFHTSAHSGEDDRPFRPKVITGSGDRDHARDGP